MRAGLRGPGSSVSPRSVDMKSTCLRPQGDLLPYAPSEGGQQHLPISAWACGESGRYGLGWGVCEDGSDPVDSYPAHRNNASPLIESWVLMLLRYRVLIG